MGPAQWLRITSSFIGFPMRDDTPFKTAASQSKQAADLGNYAIVGPILAQADGTGQRRDLMLRQYQRNGSMD